jgi:aryl-alcohol dehydrogenase-like predicted oxidoreductase
MLFGEQSKRTTPEADAIKMVHRFLDMGGNHIDTADGYAQGVSEEIVGKAMKGRRRGNIVATKLRFPTGDHPNESGLSPHHIMEGIHDSLRRLGMDHIDLLYCHAWDPITPIQETMRALDDLVTSGKLRYLGVSNFKSWQVMKAQGLADHLGYHRFIAGQYQYSLVKRDIEEEYLDLFENEGIGLLPWGPLGGGFLTGKYKRNEKPQEGRILQSADHQEESWERRNKTRNWDTLELLEQFAQEKGATVSQLALAWLFYQKNVCSVIIGPRTMEQFEDNMAALDVAVLQRKNWQHSLPQASLKNAILTGCWMPTLRGSYSVALRL